MRNFDAIYELVTHFWLFWYGVYWHNPEDIGIAIGTWAKTFSQLPLDHVAASHEDFYCPDNLVIERITYDDWVVGKW